MIGKKFLYVVEIDALIFIAVVALIAIGSAVWENYHPHYQHIAPVPTSKKTLPLTIVPEHDRETVVWVSPDGQQELQMQTVYFKDTSKTYTFSDKDLTSGVTHRIFSETVDNATIMKIPFNSWSPDDGYIFIEKVKNGQTEYLTLHASGEPFGKDMQTLNVTSLFAAQQTGLTLHEVTGWASPTLLIITTTSDSKEAERSYWFDVTSESFIPLATQF